MRVGYSLTTVLVLTASLLWSAAAVAGPTATISGSFGDACRDFAAHSSKDISHVVIHYVDGRVVKDESATTPDFSIDGGSGEEINFVLVKSGITQETFTCTATNSPPTAVLEINTPAECAPFGDEFHCHPYTQKTGWTRASDITSASGAVTWGCDAAAPEPCLMFSYRGTSSTDSDNDITSWSIEFGDGTSTGLITGPLAEMKHTYQAAPDSFILNVVVTLTVTDSAGQSDSDAFGVRAFVDQQD